MQRGKGVKNLSLTHTPKIETERLILRKFTANDLNAFFLIFADKEVNTYLPWFPIQTLEEAKVFLEKRYLKAYLKPHGYDYAICMKHDNIPVGYINVDMDDSHDLGYGLCKEFWHKGIAAEAGRALIAQLKKDGIPYITATHDVNNARSGSVMKRLGMKYQYSYEEQWQPKDFPVTFRLYQLNLDGNDSRVYQKYWNNSAVHFVEKEV